WQRNRLSQRVSANPTLKRVYLLTLRQMVQDVMQLDRIFARIDQLFLLTAPDRTADLARWSTVRSSTQEAKDVLRSQRTSLSNYLAAVATGLPPRDRAPVIIPPGGQLDQNDVIQITTAAGWQAYFTLDGSDPRLSPQRRLYTDPIPAGTNSFVLKAAAILVGQAIASGNWTDLSQQTFYPVPRPRLSIRQVGLVLQLSWSAQFTNHVLEAATALGGPWNGPIGTPTQVGDELRVEQAP